VTDPSPHDRERNPPTHHAAVRDVRQQQDITRPSGHAPIIPSRPTRREEPSHMGGLPPATDPPRRRGGIPSRGESSTRTGDPPETYLPRHQDDRIDLPGRRPVTRDSQYRADQFDGGENYSCSDCEESESVLQNTAQFIHHLVGSLFPRHDHHSA